MLRWARLQLEDGDKKSFATPTSDSGAHYTTRSLGPLLRPVALSTEGYYENTTLTGERYSRGITHGGGLSVARRYTVDMQDGAVL